MPRTKFPPALSLGKAVLPSLLGKARKKLQEESGGRVGVEEYIRRKNLGLDPWTGEEVSPEEAERIRKA